MPLVELIFEDCWDWQIVHLAEEQVDELGRDSDYGVVRLNPRIVIWRRRRKDRGEGTSSDVRA